MARKILPLLFALAAFFGLRYFFAGQPPAAGQQLFKSGAPYVQIRLLPPEPSQPPALKIYFPADNSTIRSSNLNFRGWATPGATVKIKPVWDEETPVTAGPDGRFSCSYYLPKKIGEPDGLLEFIFTAADGNNKTTKTVRLKDPAWECPSGWIDVLHPLNKHGQVKQYPNTYDGLRSFLLTCRKMPDYLADCFDCSNSSSMLCSCLQVSGFKASIVAGTCPWNKSLGPHAWVIVHTDNRGPVAVESTVFTNGRLSLSMLKVWSDFTFSAPGLITPERECGGDTAAENYYRYGSEYPDVYAAVRASGSAGEWNWWFHIGEI